MKLHKITFILLVIGGLNWLLVGLGVTSLGDLVSMEVARVVFILVGLSAIYEIATHKKTCSCCKGGSSTM